MIFQKQLFNDIIKSSCLMKFSYYYCNEILKKNKNNTSLHVAIQNKNIEIIKLLISDPRIDINETDQILLKEIYQIYYYINGFPFF